MHSNGSHPTLLYSPESERAVLYCLLHRLDEDDQAEVFDRLAAEDFADPRNAVVFRAAASLQGDGAPVELEATIERLRQEGRLGEAGGVPHISAMLDTVSEKPAYHADIVAGYSLRRKLRKALQDGVDLTLEMHRDLTEIAHEVERSVMAATQGRRERDSLRDLNSYLLDFVSAMEKSEAGLSWGFADLDGVTRGMRKERLYMILARPSMGKSAFCEGVALNAAITHGKRVAYFSVENGAEEWLEVAFAWAGRFDVHTFRLVQSSARPDLAVGGAEFASAARALQAVAPNLHLDVESRTVSAALRKARRMKARGGLDLAVFDHLHEMEGPGDSEEQRVAKIARDCKAMAKELGIPVLAAAQLNRKCEDRPDKRPHYSDARASGGIEEAADTMGLLYRPEFYFGAQMPVGQGKQKHTVDVTGYAEWIIGKNRGGPRTLHGRDCVPLFFRAECVRFESYSGRRDW